MEEIFGSYGEIRNLKLNIGKSVKTLSAIITFKKDRDAEQALINMDGGQIDGNVVKISFVLVSNSKRTTDEGQPLENDSAGKRISTGKLLKGRSCKNEAGTSGIYEADNIRRGLINFTDFCGLSDSDEVRFLIICQFAKSAFNFAHVHFLLVTPHPPREILLYYFPI